MRTLLILVAYLILSCNNEREPDDESHKLINPSSTLVGTYPIKAFLQTAWGDKVNLIADKYYNGNDSLYFATVSYDSVNENGDNTGIKVTRKIFVDFSSEIR